MRKQRSKPDADGANARYHIDYEPSPHTCENVINFIECLPVPSGALAGEGKLIKLMPWQRRLIENVWPRKGKNKNEVLLCVARRNGKTVFLAALMTFLLFNRHKKSAPAPGSLMVSAATNKEQAALTYDIIALWCATVIELYEASEVTHYHKTIDILTSEGTRYKAISSGSRQALGGNYAAIFCDEQGFARDNRLTSALRSGMASTPPDKRLFLQASTCPEDRNHFFYEELQYFADNKTNPRHYALVCMADPRVDPPNAERTWKKSNPSYGVLVHRESFVEEWSSAKSFPQRRQGFCAYRCNMPTGMIAVDEARFVSIEAWDKCKNADNALIGGEQIVVAWDAATTQDLTAVVAMSIARPHRTWCKFFIPKAAVEQHKHIPYLVWASEGHCELITTQWVHKQLILDEYIKLQKSYDLVASQSDLFGYPEIAKLGEEQGVDLTRHTARKPRQADTHDGLQKLSEIINEQALYHNNPVLSFCVTNMRVKKSRAGDALLVDRELSTKRGQKIDGAISLMLCALMIAGATPPTTELNFEGIVL